MARDYAKKKPPAKAPFPGWAWMVVGLLVGLFVAFLVHLSKTPPRHSPRPTASAHGKKGEDARAVAKTQAQAPEKSKLNFDFYNMLPQFEVPVPEDETSMPPKPNEPPPKPKALEAGTYIIQAGSFRHAKDAETRKAELALLGVVSQVQEVTIADGQTWHRVKLGPYRDLKKLTRVRRLLRENKIEYMLLKQRG